MTGMAARFGGEVLGRTLAKGLDIAFKPLNAGINALTGKLNDVINSYNPLIAMVKAIGDAAKVEEKALAMNISFAKSFDAVKDLRAAGGIQLDLMEAQKVLLENFNQGIRTNSVGMASLQEEMRITGQNSNSLRKAVAELGISTKDDIESVETLVASNKYLSDRFKISNEKLIEAVGGMSREVKVLGLLNNMTGPMQLMTQGMQALGRGRLTPGQISSMMDLISSGAEQARAARAMLGIGEDVIEQFDKISKEGPEKQIQFLKTNIFEPLQSSLENLGISNEQITTELGTTLEAFGNNITELAGVSKIIQNTTKEQSDNFIKQMGEEKASRARMNTVNADLEKAINAFKSYIADNLPAIKEVMFHVGRVITDAFKWVLGNIPGTGDALDAFPRFGAVLITEGRDEKERASKIKELAQGRIRLSEKQISTLASGRSIDIDQHKLSTIESIRNIDIEKMKMEKQAPTSYRHNEYWKSLDLQQKQLEKNFENTDDISFYNSIHLTNKMSKSKLKKLSPEVLRELVGYEGVGYSRDKASEAYDKQQKEATEAMIQLAEEIRSTLGHLMVPSNSTIPLRGN